MRAVDQIGARRSEPGTGRVKVDRPAQLPRGTPLADHPTAPDRPADRLLTTRSPVLRVLVVAAAAWGCGWLLLLALQVPTADAFARIVAVAGAGAWTVLLYLLRRLWLPLARRRPVRVATGLGIAGGAVVETLLWAAQHTYRVQGLATHDELLIALAIAMPWYVLLVGSFVQVQRRRRFPLAQVLLLGALYRLGADAIVDRLLLDGVLLRPDVWAVLGVAWFWQFIVLYAPVVALPAVALSAEPAGDVPTPGRAWLDALRPLAWLLVYLGYVVVAEAVVRLR
jgi:hypothetical protein